VTGPVTLQAVARAAGVSVATASKALNQRAGVSPSTRERVLALADRLGFVPNEVARGLVAGRTSTVGLLTSDLEGRFVLPVLMGAEDAFGAGQVSVFLCDARGDAIREQYHLRALLTRRVDGIIVVGSRTDPRPSLGHSLPVPVVYAYATSEDPADLSLTPDNVAGGRAMVEHLLECGRRRIAHITGDPTYAAARDRATGVAAALDQAGLELLGGPMYSTWSEQWGRDAAGVLLAQHEDIDGIACGSDLIARGVLDTLRDLGRRVPEDVAVIGFDNWDVLVTHSRPTLTSVDPNLEHLGRQAARALFAAMAPDGGPAGGTQSLPVRLVIRGSTIAHR
jgi:LacI family transcriptional regulator